MNSHGPRLSRVGDPARRTTDVGAQLRRRSDDDRVDARMDRMSREEIEAEALKLEPAARARLAERLLESLEALSEAENDKLWSEEAERRDVQWPAGKDSTRSAADVVRDARNKLG